MTTVPCIVSGTGAEEPRKCLACSKPLVRREGEHNTNFRRRRYCNRSCGCVAGLLSKGMQREKRQVPCSRGCGRILLRSVHLSDACCPSCSKERQRQSENAYNAKLKEEARRYRILMAALGWESFEEVIAYLRTVPWASIKGRPRRNLHADAIGGRAA